LGLDDEATNDLGDGLARRRSDWSGGKVVLLSWGPLWFKVVLIAAIGVALNVRASSRSPSCS
jgi:hypothetical protein